mgnify:CR=1 FL=1
MAITRPRTPQQFEEENSLVGGATEEYGKTRNQYHNESQPAVSAFQTVDY